MGKYKGFLFTFGALLALAVLAGRGAEPLGPPTAHADEEQVQPAAQPQEAPAPLAGMSIPAAAPAPAPETPPPPAPQPEPVKQEPAPTPEPPPPPAPAKQEPAAEPLQEVSEAAVFGKVRLMEQVNGISMPVNDQSASVYLGLYGTKKVYKVHASDAGDFGVYLPGGSYRVLKVKTNGYKFSPHELYLYVPAGEKAVYAGTVVLDGRPSGVVPGSVSGSVVTGLKRMFGASDTYFAFTVKDEQKDLEAEVRMAAPEADVRLVKSLFNPRGGVASGRYPEKVARATDVQETLKAGSEAVEDWVGGTLITLPYIVSPVWLFTLPFD